MTNYEFWQLEKYGNIKPEIIVMPDGTCENGEDEIKRQAEWVEIQAEILRHELEQGNY
jgi:hypothetical protein